MGLETCPAPLCLDSRILGQETGPGFHLDSWTMGLETTARYLRLGFRTLGKEAAKEGLGSPASGKTSE